MKIYSANDVHQALNFDQLINALDSGFAQDYSMPQRQVYSLTAQNHDAFAVLPAWNNEVIGVKAFTYFPENPTPEYQSLYSKIMLFDRQHGTPLALVDGSSVTYWRTAAVSALASRYLSRSDARRLLICGSGNLSPYMVEAHASVRPIDEVIWWGRDRTKVQAKIEHCASKMPHIQFHHCDNLTEQSAHADIICGATGSLTPVILGDWVTSGTHIDLIGNHSPTGRECDSDLIVKSEVYLDSWLNVLNEAGEILIPISEGAFTKEQIKGELSELCKGAITGRQNTQAITLFKSVGTALSDLIGAHLVTKNLK
ncbi:ornithine cyclodeaminase family protein [Pleionea sp. CnH1-48]|uniref:ornithine cyclodeaminase family protein n=1 Tax=Pleionea sp. CnH1-48 TaxID=2954494 RepID=UPI002096AE82|nr:ornithine cyclodeaminase family protein [Pleionea sp. CnH1-48]